MRTKNKVKVRQDLLHNISVTTDTTQHLAIHTGEENPHQLEKQINPQKKVRAKRDKVKLVVYCSMCS